MATPKLCQRCRGGGVLEADLKNLGTLDYDRHVIGCPDCSGEGVRRNEPDRVYVSVELRNEQPWRPKY